MTGSIPDKADNPSAAAQMAAMIFGVILLDADLRIAQINPAAEEMLGRSAKRAIGAQFFELVHMEDALVRDRLAETDEGLTVRGLRLDLRSGSRVVNMTISPMAAAPGWKVVTLSHGGPLDGEGEAAQSSLRGPSVLAHEIKNPLAAIKGAGQLVARKLSEKDRPLAAMITGEVDRIARLIDRMQSLGKTTPEPVAECNQHEAIRSAVTTVRSSDAGDVSVVEEFDPSLPPVLANQDALEQVLINLIANARDVVAGRDGGQINVKTRFGAAPLVSTSPEGKSVRLPIEITISDNGSGIDPALADEIFEPFVSSKTGGQGLGLPLVRKLMRDMQGRVTHERDNAAGLTHFRLHLPIASKDS